MRALPDIHNCGCGACDLHEDATELSAGVDVSLVNKNTETPWPGLSIESVQIRETRESMELFHERVSVSNISFLICSGVIPVLIPMQSADNGAAQMR